MSITHNEVQGTELTTSLVALYTVPTSKKCIALEIAGAVYSGAGAAQQLELQFVPASASHTPANRYRIMELAAAQALAAGTPFRYTFNPNLPAGTEVYMKTTTNGCVSVHISATERS